MGLALDLGSGSIPPSGRSRPQFQLWTRPRYQLQSPRQSLRSLRGSEGTRHGWDPGPLHQYHDGDPKGPGPPSRPVLQDRGSLHHPGLSRPLHQQQRLPHLSSYHLPRVSGGPYFVGHPIPGNVRLHSRDFHGESYYDVPALMADHRFRDSMRLIKHYSLLPFMAQCWLFIHFISFPPQLSESPG